MASEVTPRGEPAASELASGSTVDGPEIATADAHVHAVALGLTGAADRRLLERGATVGRYVILARLGAGGMGEVYAAYDPELDRKVALKLLRAAAGHRAAAASERLVREAQALARLSHPHVVPVHDVGTALGEVYVAMEFAPGGSLGDWLRASARLRPWRDVLARFVAAGRGLAAAHRAGIVHRDFKPDNVLIGEDGRMLVADFGLARPAEMAVAGKAPSRALDADEQSGSLAGMTPRSALDTPLTQAGAVMGTPAYMAPEQYRGIEADARADQFAFAVSLYSALFGELPFEGATLAEYRHAVLQGRVRPAPPASRTPSWLRALLLRALATSPDARFPSMGALLDELAKDPVAARRRALLLGGVAVALCAGGIALYHAGDAQSLVCKGAERKLTGLWDDEKKVAVRASFLGTGKPYAQSALRGVDQALGAYTRAWSAMHEEACEATRLRGEASAELLDLRMGCLERRRKELRALTELFTRADAAVVEHAVPAAHALTTLAGCADAEQLVSRVKEPSDPAVRARVDAARTILSETKALFDAGKYSEALPRAEAVMKESSATLHRPLVADAALLLADARERSGDLAGAEASLHEAAQAAEAGRVDHLAAKAWAKLVHVVGTRRAQPVPAHGWERYARAAIERLAGDEELEGMLENNVGGLLASEGKLDDALDRYRRALALREKTLGNAHPLLAHSHSNLGIVLRRLGRHDEALVQLRAAVDIGRRALGDAHPDVGTSLLNLASLHFERHDDARALAVAEEALRVLEAALGEGHAEVASARNNIGAFLERAGDFAHATPQLERALAARKKTLGPEHPSVAASLTNLGIVAGATGEHTKAASLHAQALRIYEKAFGPRHPDVAAALENLGREELLLREPAKALPLFTRALELQQAAVGAGKDDPQLTNALTGLGEALVATGARERGIALLRRALAILEKSGEPTDLAETRFALAQCLPRGDGEALTLARLARESYAKAGVRYQRERALIDAWLGTRKRRSGAGLP